MKPLKIALITFFMSSAIGSVAQEKKAQNYLHFSTGKNWGYTKDVNFSPLNYTLNGFPFQLAYNRINSERKSDFEVAFDFEKNNLKSNALPEVPTDNLVWNLRICYLKAIKNWSSNAILSLGGTAQTRFNYITFLDDYAYSFLIAHSLNLSAKFDYLINEKQNVSARIGIPVFSFLVRPPYSGFDEEFDENLERPLRFITDGKVVVPNKYSALDWSLTYHYALSEKWTLIGTYELAYQRTNEIHPIVNFENAVKCGITRKL